MSTWQDLAECRGLDPALFHPERGERVAAPAETACRRCPVRLDCLEHAITHNERGYWAGTSGDDRKRIRRRRAEARATSDHGTLLGYGRHILDGETPCEPCQAAHDGNRVLVEATR